jgi:hypothetical protein
MSDLWAIAITFGFVVAGFVLAIAAKRYFEVDNSGLSISLLVVPFAIYLLASGKIEQFEGFGINTSFQVLANTEISESKIGTGLILPEKPSIDAITEMEQALVQLSGSDNVVFIRAEQKLSPSDRVAKALLIKNGLLSGKLRFVIVIDGKGRPLGYFYPHNFLDLIHLQFEFAHYPDAGEPDEASMYRAMMQTIYWDIIENPEMRAETWGEKLFISPSETLAGAFQTLHKAKAVGAIVTNQRGEYRGFVMLNEIMEELTLAFLKATGSGTR